MQLRLKSSDRPTPEKPVAIFVRGAQPVAWLQAIAGLNFSLEQTTTYAVPGTTANTLSGCIFVTPVAASAVLPPTITRLKLVANRLFIPDHATLYPVVNDDELIKLLPGSAYLLHPETGLVAFEMPLDWRSIISLHDPQEVRITTPANPVFMPATIRRFEIRGMTEEEALQQLESKVAPEQKTFKDKPLNAAEKIRLAVLRKLFGGLQTKSAGTGAHGLLGKMSSLIGRLEDKYAPFVEKMKQDLEDLERRNASEVDKLLRLMEKDPDEALKYAIPLSDGVGRGGNEGTFNLSKRWNDLSLFASEDHHNGVGGNALLANEYHNRLLQEYGNMAAAYMKAGDFEKAAFVYMKLMRHYRPAAEALEKGGLYAEAAAIHLKYTGDKSAAADCYLKANMITKAIELYMELGQHEQAGDLLMKLNRKEEAVIQYQKMVDGYLSKQQHVKAAAITRDKMNDMEGAQQLLAKGWRSGRDSCHCFHTYFSNIGDRVDALKRAVTRIYEEDVVQHNCADFLKALKNIPASDSGLSGTIRRIAYELISTYAPGDGSLIFELKYFNARNTLIGKDIMRYKLATKKGRHKAG